MGQVGGGTLLSRDGPWDTLGHRLQTGHLWIATGFDWPPEPVTLGHQTASAPRANGPCPVVPRWGQTAQLALGAVVGHHLGQHPKMRKGGSMKKVLVTVRLTAKEKATMAAIARREGKSLTAWAAGAIRAARDRTA